VRLRVVIVGAGFAGLNAAHALRRADADVTIVDGHGYHTFQPLLYQVSTDYLAPEEVGAALWAVFRRQANVRVRIGKASGLDYPAHALVLQDGSRLDFDYLIVAAGVEANFFGRSGQAGPTQPAELMSRGSGGRAHKAAAVGQQATNGTSTARKQWQKEESRYAGCMRSPSRKMAPESWSTGSGRED
jgi:NADH dehydrogenase